MGGPGNSRTVVGGPPDPRVSQLVRRHLARAYAKPIQAHNRRAFDWLAHRLGDQPRFVLDSGCGTGISTSRLAARHPDRWMVGVDKSAARLARGAGLTGDQVGVQRDRVLWVRADLVDIWRLAHAAGWRCERHYLLYPNPWPKPAHVGRRWHGHAVFPTLLAVSCSLIVRTNWPTYAQELGAALSAAGWSNRRRPAAPDDDLSPFEAKYRASGHPLVEIIAEAPTASL